MQLRPTFVHVVALLGFTSIIGACSANPGQEQTPPQSEPNAVPGSTSALPSPTSNVAPALSENPTLSPSEDLIDPLGGSGPGTPNPSNGQACKLAILGDPGSNPGANFAEWIEERGPVVDRYLAGPELQGFATTDLQTYQVVLLDRLAPGTVVGIAPDDLSSWVHGGGRVIALSGYGDYPEVVEVQNRMLEPLGLGFVSDSPVWGPVTQFASHPITAGLQSLTFVGGRQVTHDPLDEVIMTLNDPALPVAVVATRGAGRLFLFGDEWVTFDSEWVSMPEIEQFWVNIFDWLGGCKLTPVSMIK